jgi:hypothetical protein
MDLSKSAVAVVGATGYTGRFVVADLLRRGITPIAIARNAAALEAADFDQKVIRRQATVDDTGSLDRSLEGADVVLNTAGPFADTAVAVASAALWAKIHSIDVAAEQGAPTKLFEKFDEPARKAGVVVLLLARHVKTAEHHNYITRVAVAEVTDPSTPPPKAADEMGRSAQNFVLDVVVTRGAEQRRAFTWGGDGYAATAPLTGEAVEGLMKGQFRSAGAKAPGEIFDAEGLLRALAPDHATFEVVKAG